MTLQSQWFVSAAVSSLTIQKPLNAGKCCCRPEPGLDRPGVSSSPSIGPPSVWSSLDALAPSGQQSWHWILQKTFKTLKRLVWRKGSHDLQEVTAHSQYPTAEAEGLFSPVPAVCWGFAGGAHSCAAYILRTGGGLWTRAAPLGEAPYWAARPLWWAARRPAGASHLWASLLHLGFFFILLKIIGAFDFCTPAIKQWKH